MPRTATHQALFAEPAPSSSFVGLRHLLRLALRRDRLRIVLWVAGLVGVVVATVESITGLYSTPAELEQYARIVRGNTTLIVQAGPGYGLDDPTLGAVMMNELSVWVAIAVALMNIFVVVRHTRTEETTENAELTRAAPVGRYAGTAAALLCALISTVAVAAGVGLVLAMSGLPVAGTMAFTMSLIGAGSVFAIAHRRDVTDRRDAALGARPGWCRTGRVVRRPRGRRHRRRTPVLDARRSAGPKRSVPSPTNAGGCCSSPPGPPRCSSSPRSHSRPTATSVPGCSRNERVARQRHRRWVRRWGSSVRLQRASIVAWSVGLGLMGFFYGVVGEQAESIFEENPELESYFAHLGDASITDAFLATSILMMALLAMGLTVSSVLRLRSEEVAFRADLVHGHTDVAFELVEQSPRRDVRWGRPLRWPRWAQRPGSASPR